MKNGAVKYQDETKLIAKAIEKKSIRSFSWRQKDIHRQASYFSPIYRDFIYKVIQNRSLKIISTYRTSCLEPGEEPPEENSHKRRKNKIYTELQDVSALPHELGHAIDFWFGASHTLTSTVLLSNEKTLEDIFTEEFESKYQEVYRLIMGEYKRAINSTVGEGAYETLMSNMGLYQELGSLEVDLKNKETTKKRRRIQKELYERGFVEAYYRLYTSDCCSTINDQYGCILDALSSKYDFYGLLLFHHSFDYYQKDKSKVFQEFFANLFGAEVTSRRAEIETVSKLLPKSFRAFQELFFIFYDHLQQNKRFIDVKMRKAHKSDEL